MSSATLLRFGSSSVIVMPHFPARLNLNFEGAIGKPRLAGGHRGQALALADRVGQSLSYHFCISACSRRGPSARAADHVQVDDLLGLRDEVGPDPERRALPSSGARRSAAEGRHRGRAHQVRPAGEELPAAQADVLVEEVHALLAYLFEVSSRFRSWLHTIVHAARSAAIERGVGLRLADRDQGLRILGFAL
jgi:hypothetical protein